MAKTVKMCDMSADVVAKVLEMLNPGVKLMKCHFTAIATDIEPKDLVYPEGWYYAKGTIRNKHTSSTGFYEEIYLYKVDGTSWGECAKYCTK